MSFSVKVTDIFSLDAGSIIENGDVYLIVPPEKTMFGQLNDWLLQQPTPNIGLNNWALGIGATALCIRWGTYLSVLMDETKPVDQRAKDGFTSMISNQEMKRINIEASSNFSYLLKKMYEDEFEAFDLLLRAYEALPMPQKRVKRERQAHEIIIGTMMVVNSNEFAERSKIAVANPFRSIANMIVNLSYRNGPIENIHAGSEFGYSLKNCRFTNKQMSTVVRFSAEHLSGIMGGMPIWDKNIPGVTEWPQRLAVLPLSVFYPRDWSMTESSSHIKLQKEWVQ